MVRVYEGGDDVFCSGGGWEGGEEDRGLFRDDRSSGLDWFDGCAGGGVGGLVSASLSSRMLGGGGGWRAGELRGLVVFPLSSACRAANMVCMLSKVLFMMLVST